MARRNNEPEAGTDRSKIRVFFAEVEGNTQTIQDLMRTLAVAIGRPVPATPASARLPISPNPTDVTQPFPVLEEQGGIIEADGQVTTSDQESGVIPVAVPSPRLRRGQGQKTDRNAGLVPVGDIDFVPNGQQPLKEFFAEKSPGTDMEQVLVICHYLQEVLDIASYGPGQILSAFRHVGSPVPVDLRQTIRNMKSKKAWVNFTDLESLRTTTEGENFVTYSLPKSASVKKGK